MTDGSPKAEPARRDRGPSGNMHYRLEDQRRWRPAWLAAPWPNWCRCSAPDGLALHLHTVDHPSTATPA